MAGGGSVRLDGRYSIAWQGTAATYRWRQTSGTPVVLDDDSSARPRFTAPRPVSADEVLGFELALTDGRGATATDSVAVRVLAPASLRYTAQLTVRERSTGRLIGSYSYDVNDSYPILTAPEGRAAGIVFRGAEELIFSLDPDAQPGQRLQPGSWTTTTASSVGPPRLNVVVPGQPPLACSAPLLEATRLDIADARYGTNGLEDLAFAFAQVCRDITIAGAVQYHSAVVVAAPDAQADAGADQLVQEATTVLPRGAALDARGGRVPTLSWRQVSGPLARLDARDRGVAAFVSPAVTTDTELVFELTVDDGSRVLTDTVKVTVRDNGLAGFATDVLAPRPTGSAKPIGLRGPGSLVELAASEILTGGSGGDARPRETPYTALSMAFVVPSGGSQPVDFVLTDAAPSGARWVGYTPDTNTWRRFDGASGVSVDRRTLTFTFVDGGAGDDDGIANGRIVAKGTIGLFEATGAPDAGAGGSSGSGGGGGGSLELEVLLALVAAALSMQRRLRDEAGRRSHWNGIIFSPSRRPNTMQGIAIMPPTKASPCSWPEPRISPAA